MLSISALAKTLGKNGKGGNAQAEQNSFALYIDELRIDSPGVYGLMGANGCGKSTTTKLIAGIFEPDGGKIETDLDRRDITMVTQKPYIMDDTVFNNLAYPLRVRGVRDYHALCDQWLEKINLSGRKHMRARGLSGGEKQKLSLLRAMIFKPRLIILDEAMTDLDLDSLDMFIRMIGESQARDPVTWIIISHQLTQIRRLCQYVFFMAGGRLVAEGPTEELLRSEHPDVRRYLRHEIVE